MEQQFFTMNKHWYVAFQALNNNNNIYTGFFVLESVVLETSAVYAYIQSKFGVNYTIVLLNIIEISTNDYNKYPDHCKMNIK